MTAPWEADEVVGGGAAPWANDEVVSAPKRPPAAPSNKWVQKAGEGLLPAYNRAVALGAAATDPLFGLGKGESFGQRYDRNLRAEQAQSSQTQREHPWASALLETAGGVPAAIATGGGSAGANALGEVSRVAQALQGARSGAGLGAMYAAGNAPADASVGGVLARTGAGAVGGGVLGAGVGAMMPSHQVPQLAQDMDRGTLGNLAERAAVRSTNADRSAFRRAFGRPMNEDKRQAVGRYLLDADIPLRSPSAMQEGLEGALDRQGQAIGNLTDAATQAGAKVNLWGAAVKAIQRPPVADLNKNTMTRGAHDRVIEFLRDQIARSGEQITPLQAHDLRMQLDNLAKWDAVRTPELVGAWRAVRGALSDELGASMQRSGFGEAWAGANAAYSRAATAKGLADVGAERMMGNRLGSPSEKAAAIAGGALGVMHNPVAGVGLPLGTAALNRGFFPVTAHALNAASGVQSPGAAGALAADPALVDALAAYLNGDTGDSQVAALAQAMRRKK